MNIAIRPENINTQQELAGKVSLVTGSTSGIGLGIARALAAAGSEVVLNGFGKPEDVANAQEKIASEFKVRVSHSPADMSNPGAIRDMIQGTLQSSGRLDILVNNAGIQHVAPLQEFPPEKWDAILAINLSSAFHTTRLVLPSMLRNQWGRIINIASAHGLVASPFKSAYVTAKHGMVGLTKVTALETAEQGITCNAVCRLRLYAPRRGADRGPSKGTWYPARAGHPRCSARATAEQTFRHGRGARRPCRLPRERRCSIHHRRGIARGWRLDRALSAPSFASQTSFQE